MLWISNGKEEKRLTRALVAALLIGLVSSVPTANAAPPESPSIGQATNVTATTATLNGVLNPTAPGEGGTYQFLYKASESECAGEAATPEPPGATLGGQGESVTANVAGLLPNTSYTFCLLERNPADESAVSTPVTFVTPAAPPTVEGEWSTNVAESSADLHAGINPNGAETTYHFEYGIEASYGNRSVESLSIGSDDIDHAVMLHIQGLLPATVYHYRVSASNAQSPAGSFGSDGTFTTRAATAPFVLPDRRQWELVSPPSKGGGRLVPLTEESFIQAAASGNAIAYTSFLAPIERDPAGFTTQDQVFSWRASGGSWSSHDINPPHEEPIGPSAGNGGEYKLFSKDLSLGLVEPFGEGHPPLSTKATERTIYLRDDAPVIPEAPEQALYAEAEAEALGGQLAGYLPLVTPANVPPGTVFGGKAPRGTDPGVSFEGATSDLNHVILRSHAPLTDDALEAGLENVLYEWSEGRLRLVATMPESSQEPFLGGGSPPGENARNAISSDGSRVVWTAGSHVYITDLSDSRTRVVRLDVPTEECVSRGYCAVEEGEADFQFASSNGTKVFFTDNRPLTTSASAGGADLYECQMVEIAGKLTCSLTDLTPHTTERAEVLGVVPGGSEDGSYMYLVANGVLAEGATSGQNLYVLHNDGEGWSTRLIAKLSVADEPDWAHTPVDEQELTGLSSRVTPNGRYIAFMSQRSLTGYDNHDANTERLDEEVYLYHTEVSQAGRLEAGQLICASCNPSGARPIGLEAKPAPEESINEDNVWPRGVGLAANVPGWVGSRGRERARYQPRYLSDSGRLFFNGVDQLVSQAANGVANVYEYEPEGVGSCVRNSATFAVVNHGCVALISGATSGEESVFLDASETGDDVFFLTSAKLTPGDHDTASDVYDAHVCETLVPCQRESVATQQCVTADACRSAPTPQPTSFGAPASAMFTGAGNLGRAAEPSGATGQKCRRGLVRQNRRCVKRGRKRHTRRMRRMRHKGKGK